jgi:hypothetical protein
MNAVMRIADKLAGKAIGSVDAGACIADRGCCCTPGVPNYGLDCFGHCVTETCSDVRSSYGVPC